MTRYIGGWTCDVCGRFFDDRAPTLGLSFVVDAPLPHRTPIRRHSCADPDCVAQTTADAAAHALDPSFVPSPAARRVP